MSGDPGTLVECPSCRRPNPSYRGTCWGCGSPLGTATGPAPAPLPFFRAPAPPASPPPPSVRGGTQTGLLLMSIGFGLAWIPFVGTAGELLLILGFFYVWNGRKDFPRPHTTYVLLAVITYVVILLSVIFFGTAITISLVGPGDFGATLAVSMAAGSIATIANALLVYAIADPESRLLLYGAFVAAIGAGAAQLQIQLHALQPLSGPVWIPSTSFVSPPSGVVDVVPYALFLWAYLRIRSGLNRRGQLSLGVVPAPDASI